MRTCSEDFGRDSVILDAFARGGQIKPKTENQTEPNEFRFFGFWFRFRFPFPILFGFSVSIFVLGAYWFGLSVSVVKCL